MVDLEKGVPVSRLVDAQRLLSKAEAVIAGSAAMKFLFNYFYPDRDLHWTVGDVDLFFLDSVEEGRKTVGQVDLVASRHKTVIELLNAFDLPCCRVAYNSQFLCFTLQAANACFNKKCYISSVLTNEKAFKKALHPIKDPEELDRIWQKTHKRIEKYRTRGIGFSVISDEVPSFLFNQEVFACYSPDGESLQGSFSLVFDLRKNCFDEVNFHRFLTHGSSEQVATWSFLPELRRKLEIVTRAEFQKFDAAVKEHREALDELKQKLYQPLDPHKELEFRMELLEKVNKLEKLQLTWNLVKP